MSPVTPENISVVAVLIVIGSLGCTLSARDGKLFVSNRASLPDSVRSAITRYRDDLLAIAEGKA
jgi:hypothetical protein